MITTQHLRRWARFVVVQAVLDYARASKIIRLGTGSPAVLSEAASDLSRIEEFIAEGENDPWIELSEFDVRWLQSEFTKLKRDPEALEAATKLRWDKRYGNP